MPAGKLKEKNTKNKIKICILEVPEEIIRIRRRIRSWIRIHQSEYGSADPDPDPHQNVTDPQHWQKVMKLKVWNLCLDRYRTVQGKLPNATISGMAEINFNWL